jgi:hypothetical protein
MTTHHTHTRATNPPSPRQAESSLDRLANAVVGKIAAGHADQGQAFRDAQAADANQGDLK